MRIVYVLGTLDIGGTETQTVRLAREVAQLGNEVIVVAIAHGGPLAADLERARIPVHILGFEGFSFRDRRGELRPWMVLSVFRKLARLYVIFRSLRPDVCHAQLFWSYSLALPIASLARVPVRVSGRRGRSPVQPSGVLRMLLNRLSNSATTCYVTNSSTLAREQIAEESLPPAKFTVIANGVDLPERISIQENAPRAVVLANLISYKGHEDLLRGLSSMKYPLDTTLIGDGPERPHLEQLMKDLGLSKIVHFAGSLHNARDLLPTFQIGILTSHHEGLPNAVLEYMAAGLAIVATNVGGVPELLRDSQTGMLVPPGCPTRLAAALDILVTDAGLRIRIAARARCAAAMYSWNYCVENHVLMYQRNHKHRSGCTDLYGPPGPPHAT